MTTHQFSEKLKRLIEHAAIGKAKDIDFIMQHLSTESCFAMTRFVDYALSLVENETGVERIKFYLFNGTSIQRNYASLYFNRRGDWKYVKQALDNGLIDELQAYSR